MENLVPTGFRYPDLPTSSELLYLLSYSTDRYNAQEVCYINYNILLFKFTHQRNSQLYVTMPSSVHSSSDDVTLVTCTASLRIMAYVHPTVFET
jgi:hypothetical protein